MFLTIAIKRVYEFYENSYDFDLFFIIVKIDISSLSSSSDSLIIAMDINLIYDDYSKNLLLLIRYKVSQFQLKKTNFLIISAQKNMHNVVYFLNFFGVVVIFKASNERKNCHAVGQEILGKQKADAFTRGQSLKLNSSLSARDDRCQTIKRPSDLYAQLNFAGTWTGNAK